jgi:hypothetical protein
VSVICSNLLIFSGNFTCWYKVLVETQLPAIALEKKTQKSIIKKTPKYQHYFFFSVFLNFYFVELGLLMKRVLKDVKIDRDEQVHGKKY